MILAPSNPILRQGSRFRRNQRGGKGDIARRSEGEKVGLAHNLQFARQLLSSVEVRLAVQVALGKVVRAMGVNEFPAKVQMASPNVPRPINPAPQPDAGHTQSAPATVAACPARAVRTGFIGPAVIARTRLKCVETPTGLGHNPGHKLLRLDPESVSD